jgi:hypothetical protein
MGWFGSTAFGISDSVDEDVIKLLTHHIYGIKIKEGNSIVNAS